MLDIIKPFLMTSSVLTIFGIFNAPLAVDTPFSVTERESLSSWVVKQKLDSSIKNLDLSSCFINTEEDAKALADLLLKMNNLRTLVLGPIDSFAINRPPENPPVLVFCKCSISLPSSLKTLSILGDLPVSITLQEQQAQPNITGDALSSSL